MSTKLRRAATAAVAAMFLTALFGAEQSGASAQSTPVAPSIDPAASPSETLVTEPQAQPLPATPALAKADTAEPAADAHSLAELIEATPVPQDVSRELACLAGAIYFEAKGESLAGQLAVGRVIVARSKSGRFPASYCGVVYQRSQFSFIRGQSMPTINKAGREWSNAARIARIAHEGSWKSPVEGALFFHAARVSPRWNLTRLARVDNHIFYR
jgi:spore germination cell wall hydrolase CwlJ-like protein